VVVALWLSPLFHPFLRFIVEDGAIYRYGEVFSGEKSVTPCIPLIGASIKQSRNRHSEMSGVIIGRKTQRRTDNTKTDDEVRDNPLGPTDPCINPAGMAAFQSGAQAAIRSINEGTNVIGTVNAKQDINNPLGGRVPLMVPCGQLHPELVAQPGAETGTQARP
jgi:hypothetical protein